MLAASQATLIALAEMDRRDAFLLVINHIGAARGLRNLNVLFDAVRNPTSDHRALAAQLRTLFVDNNASPSSYVLLNAIGSFNRPLGTIGMVLWTNTMRPYRRSPEFKQHMRASGSYDYWRVHGFPPQCRAVGGDDFECN